MALGEDGTGMGEASLEAKRSLDTPIHVELSGSGGAERVLPSSDSPECISASGAFMGLEVRGEGLRANTSKPVSSRLEESAPTPPHSTSPPNICLPKIAVGCPSGLLIFEPR